MTAEALVRINASAKRLHCRRAALTSLESHAIAAGVIRFFVLLLTSLSLLLSPAAAAAAPVASSTAQTECSMPASEMDMGTEANHDKMDCCTLQCTAPAAAAVLGSNDLGSDIHREADPRVLFPLDAMLPSVSPAATDPPPRLRLT